MANQSKTYTFHVKGMHCKSCEVLTESELKDFPKIKNVRANYKYHSVEVTGDFGEISQETLAIELSEPLLRHGYSLALEEEKKINWSEFKIAIPIALGFAILFIALQKLGIVNLVNSGNVSYGAAFVIGLIASVSTCMAVVGGLVLSMSANFAKEGDKIKPQIYFHSGRLISFLVFGGVIGALGSAFQLGITGTFILSLLVALVLLILGINLLDVFHFTKKLQPTLPKFISDHFLELKKANHSLTPLALGIATFFLPCGFTQSMQIYSLSTGSFMAGALTMFSFALGTLPVLLLLSFGSLGIRDKTRSGIFFKTAGLVVIFFAFFNLLNSLSIIGLIPPILSF